MSTDHSSSFLSELALDQICKGLPQVFPDILTAHSQLQLLNAGFSSYVVLVEDRWILRIARHAEGMAGHRKEQAILPRLQKHLAVQIPELVGQAGPSVSFPFGAVIYRKIPGLPFSLSLLPQVELSRVAQDLAGFLAALHSVALSSVSDLDLQARPPSESLWEDVWPSLHRFLTTVEGNQIRAWWESYLNDPVKDSFTPRLIHGDPWGENLLLNETLDAITGVVDFETVQIGDVAQDFAAQKYLGADFMNQVIKRYQEFGGRLEEHFSARVRGWSMLRELRGLHYAICHPESEELMDSLQKVKKELTGFGRANRL